MNKTTLRNAKRNNPTTTTTTAADTAKLLDIYRDDRPMGASAKYVVTTIKTDKWGTEFGLLNLRTDELIWTDLRQCTWTKVQ